MIPGTLVGPNELCPCGSEKKYKHCCQSVDGGTPKKRRAVVLGVLLAVGVIGVGWASTLQANRTSSSPVGVRLGTPTGQPSGATPAGKVWSQEHGHWHDIPEVGSPTSPAAGTTQSFTPPPAGDAPAGKVWSTEHGHWHDVG